MRGQAKVSVSSQRYRFHDCSSYNGSMRAGERCCDHVGYGGHVSYVGYTARAHLQDEMVVALEALIPTLMPGAYGRGGACSKRTFGRKSHASSPLQQECEGGVTAV